MAKIGIIGSGSWGIALASLLHKNGHHVTVWSAFESEIDSLKKTRKLKTLPELTLPDSMECAGDSCKNASVLQGGTDYCQCGKGN